MADVTLTYKGNTILELDNSATKSIKTAGKYLEDDIGLDYVKSGGGYTSIGDGNNFIKNYDFNLNNTGVTQWHNSGSTQDKAIDFWAITHANLACKDRSVRLSRNGNANAYLMQLFLPNQLSQFVGKNCKIIAIINGVTYTSEGILSNTGNSVESNTPYGTIRVYRYTNYYAVTIDIQDSAADYIDITGVAFGLASNLVFPPSLTTKTITQNGTYNASADNANGYSSVTINVPGSSEYPPLPSEYQELEYLTTGTDQGYPRINTGSAYPIKAGDIIRFNFRGNGTPVGKRSSGWNIAVDPANDYFSVYSGTPIFCSWKLLTQETTDWMSACGIPTSGIGDGNFDYGQWGGDYHYYGDLGVLKVSRIVVVNGGSYDTIDYVEQVIKALIPCYRKADGVNGFYDSVNEVFYTAVTGTFERGPEKQ